MNLDKIVKEMFLVEKENEKQSLKVFYNVDIHIHNPNEQGGDSMPPQAITNNTNTVQNAQQNIQQQEDFRSKIRSILNEDEPISQQETQPIANVSAAPPPQKEDFVKKASGIISVPGSEVSNIQTIEDLLDFMADKSDKSGKILDQVVIELIFAMAGISQSPLEEIVKQNDKVIIDVEYGHKKDSNIGFKVLKRSGVSNVSIVMIKDGEVINAPFDLKVFNSQLVEFRNGVMKK
jgi:hypothetical protein